MPRGDLDTLVRWVQGGGLRASDEEREEVVSELQEQHLQGRIDTEELGRRTALAYRADTRLELSRLLADLPGLGWARVSLRALLSGLWPRSPFPGLAYAGFWARVGGMGCDLLVLGAAEYWLLAGLGTGPVALLLAPAYFSLLWASTGRTLGMLLAGTRVVRQEDGGRLGLRRSLLRLAGLALGTAACLLGPAWAALDRHRQGWHDKVAGSYVVRRQP